MIITGHGQFATGFQSAIELIAGEQKNIAYVDFLENTTTDKLENSLRKAVSKLDGGNGILFLADLIGGSPFKISAQISRDLEGSGIVGGINLPMILELIVIRNNQNALYLMEKSVLIGKNGIKKITLY